MSTVKTNNVQIGQSVTATNNFTWYQPASPDGTVRLGNGNSGSVTDLVTLTSAGNLGIGTSSPGAKLELSTGTGTKLRITSTVDNNADIDFYTNGVYRGIIEGNSLGMLFGTTGALPCTFITNNTERMRLDSSGNLGLGVTPSAWEAGTRKAFQLGLGGSFSSDVTVSSVLMSSNAVNTSAGWKYINTDYASNYYQYQGAHVWRTAPSGTAGNAISFTQAMTLDASGNLLVGSTTAFAKLQAFQTANSAAGLLYQQYTTSSGTGNVVLGLRNDYVIGSNTGYMIAFQNGSAGFGGSITLNGNTTAYNTTSDQRLKTNIIPAGSAIQSILDFPIDQFDWIESGEHQDFGAVAQKAINVIPEMVQKPEAPDEMWGIDWSKAVPRLIKTIQELHEEIQTLKAKVNA